jgi:CRP-like cAMP-binding protein
MGSYTVSEPTQSAVSLQNQILSALPAGDLRRLETHLQRLSFCGGEVLYDPGDPIRFVYFPISSAISILSVMEDGETVEVATVGNEGLLGVRAFFGMETALGRAVAQCAGQAWRLPVKAFREEVGRNEQLYLLVDRYSHALLTQMFQSAGCNRLHSAEQRCARWLLAMRDRCRSNDFQITQEFLGAILGVRRQSIGLMEENLQKAGLIDYGRGKVRILNGRGLEAVSCECYRKVKDEYDRYLKVP